ncbi:MAG: hypothetical protein ACH344_08750 [Yersinia sp. (in: enterobacteria)]
MSSSDTIALIALLVSIYTIISSELKSRKSNKEQKVIKDEQDRMRKLLLEKETKSAIDEMKADLGANLVRLGTNKYRLKVFNRGKSEAKHVEIHFPDNDGDEYLVMSQVNDKFPYEILYPQQSIEIIASIHMGGKAKYKIKIVWSDKYQNRNEQDVIVSI